MLTKTYYVYIVTNAWNSALYTGVTNDLNRRIYEHRNMLVNGFSSKYKTSKLVYYEQCDAIEAAIEREKQIKAGSRSKKVTLIEMHNSEWQDLSEGVV